MKTKITKLLCVLCALCGAVLSANAADLTLTWQHEAPETVDTYTVYELQADGVTWLSIATTNTPSAQLTGVAPGVHTYRVTASNEWGESAPSDPASTPPPAASPTGLQITVTVTVTVNGAPPITVAATQ